jgi:hypothetical protein
MSALPPKADIRPRDQDVCFGSEADVTLLNFDVRFTPESGHRPLYVVGQPQSQKATIKNVSTRPFAIAPN